LQGSSLYLFGSVYFIGGDWGFNINSLACLLAFVAGCLICIAAARAPNNHHLHTVPDFYQLGKVARISSLVYQLRVE
jgi:Na+/proline symporter